MTVQAETADAFVFLNSPGLPGVFKDAFVDFQLVRAMGAQTYRGAEMGECWSTARRIAEGDFDSYYREWTTTAQRVEALGEESLARGHRISARDAFMRANTYYHTSAFFLEANGDTVREALRKSRDNFRRASEMFDYPFETVDIPYLDTTLPGYFMRPDDTGTPRKTVVIQGGADSLGWELFFMGGGAAAVERGYNVLMFDGPGQKGCYFWNPELVYRPDWHVPLSAVVDYVLNRNEVDPDRLGAIGYSMGGNLIPRGVAFEKRIKACIPNPLSPSIQLSLKGLIGLAPDSDSALADNLDFENSIYARWFRDDIAVRNGVDSVSALVDHWGLFNLDGLEDEIECRMLAVASEGEGSDMFGRAHDYYQRLRCPKDWFAFEMNDGAEAHCQTNNLARLHQVQFDWLDEALD